MINKEIKHCTDIGPCHKSIDVTLKEIGIDRQAYYGGTIIGNYCHKLLQDKNIDTLCKSITLLDLKEVGEGDIYVNSVNYCEKYNTLLKMYAKCHFTFNSADMLCADISSLLDENIKNFMSFLRHNSPETTISPKLHMIEEYIIPLSQIKGCIQIYI